MAINDDLNVEKEIDPGNFYDVCFAMFESVVAKDWETAKKQYEEAGIILEKLSAQKQEETE